MKNLVPVPPAGPWACPVCRGPSGRPHSGRLCLSCRRVQSQLGRPLVPVLPTCLSTADGLDNPAYTLLKRYKRHVGELELRTLRRHVAAALLGFLSRHAACLVAACGGPWDLLVHVPSSRGRRGNHPLAESIGSSSLLSIGHHPVLFPGSARLSHVEASPRGFRVEGKVQGRRVLLVDDTYVSGSRAQSAAAALSQAGSEVVAVVVLARIVNPIFSAAHRRYWERCSALSFDVEVCCLEEAASPATRAA